MRGNGVRFTYESVPQGGVLALPNLKAYSIYFLISILFLLGTPWIPSMYLYRTIVFSSRFFSYVTKYALNTDILFLDSNF